MMSKPPAHDPSVKSVAAALRQGTAPLTVRQKGARGELPASVGEKLEILVLLLEDPDAEIRREARATLAACDRSQLPRTLADPLTAPAVLAFAAREMASADSDLANALLENPALGADIQDVLLAQLRNSPSGDSPEPADGEGSAGPETLLQRLARMNAAQKIKRALLGSHEERLLLIRDPNKVVARAVVQSPKLSEAEIEACASMTNVAEEVLRLIAANRGFLKNYSVVRSLINNPRVPVDATLPLLARLNDRDTKSLSTNRNVPDALRSAATRRLSQRLEARRR